MLSIENRTFKCIQIVEKVLCAPALQRNFNDVTQSVNCQKLLQGGLFNWPPPKNHKFEPVSKCFQKKLEYPDWPPPKISKCQPVFRKKLKYADWPPP